MRWWEVAGGGQGCRGTAAAETDATASSKRAAARAAPGIRTVCQPPGRQTVLPPPDRPALEEPSAGAAWRTVPSWFLFGAEDRNIPAAVHRFMAERAASRRTAELAGGSHTVASPAAARVVDLTDEPAAAVGVPAHH